MTKRFMAILALAISLAVLGACSSDEGKTAKEDGAVATVNGEEIPRSEFDSLMKDTENMYAQQGFDVESMDEEMKEQLSEQVLDQLINTNLLIQSSKKEGIEVDQESVDKRMEEVKGQFESEEQYQDALKEYNMTEEKLEKQVQDDLLITRYIDQKVGDIEVSEEEVKSVYDQYKEMAKSQEQEIGEFDDMKDALEQEAIAAKKQEKTMELIDNLRKESDIKVLI